MTKAPERIWATMMDPDIARNGTFVDREEYPTKPNGDAVEYVRADLVPTMPSTTSDFMSMIDELGLVVNWDDTGSCVSIAPKPTLPI